MRRATDSYGRVIHKVKIIDDKNISANRTIVDSKKLLEK
jgi:hypothetical protein